MSLLSQYNVEKSFDDHVIRGYMFYTKELVEEFGKIIAWEKEDQVEPGEPNAAGWLLPSTYNIHRRYPDVAILIPDSMGRACGGLCAICQRMYEFQSGILNFELEKLKPSETWIKKLRSLLSYFENDSQLRDILITGGDALMSANKTLEKMLLEVISMAYRKIEHNKYREPGDKYAEKEEVSIVGCFHIRLSYPLMLLLFLQKAWSLQLFLLQ